MRNDPAGLAISELMSALAQCERARAEIPTRDGRDELRAALLEARAELERQIDEAHSNYGECELCHQYSSHGILCELCDEQVRYLHYRVRAS